MGIAERKQREKEELKDLILEAAIQLIIKEGYDNLTMRKLAGKIEYSATTIYSYFRDKKELVLSIAEMGHSMFREKLRSNCENLDDDPLLRLKVIVRTYIDMALDYPEQYRISFLTLLGDENSLISQILAEKHFPNHNLDFLEEPLRACQNRNRLGITDIETTAQILFAGLHGLASLMIFRPSLTEEHKQSLIETFYATFLSR